ncbi:hypothetical protein P691DRAFT_590811 [Macrolepiota fuliginosa MF-IS2]|uniref:Uncharacterized protein n=1 Tax=Macrolepiota fuliginosa MF-IS2 TaxID=1400762 RepID=A0A9P5XF09_9AGAR|nr:hypothetical protein P691DRAFT_590811 [Macrolepiota fuliginosa MF-IS2]
MALSTDQSPQSSDSQNAALRTCTTCLGPMRGHRYLDRKKVCPTPKEEREILRQLWNEGHHGFVRGITQTKGIPFESLHSLPSPPISPEPSTPRRRTSTPTNLRIRPSSSSLVGKEAKPTQGGPRTSVVGSLRRILSVVVDQPPTPLLSPSRSRSPTPPHDVLSVHPNDLPAVGPWNEQRRKEWDASPDAKELPTKKRASLVPTLLVGSDGQTIREGSRAEAVYRAQAAREAELERRRTQQDTDILPFLPEDDEVSIFHHDIDDTDEGSYEGSGFLRVLRSVMVSPVIVAIPVRPEDIPRVQETAARQGLHTSILDVIPRTPRGTTRMLPVALRNSLIRRTSTMNSFKNEGDNRPIVVIGRDREMTQRYVEMAQRGVMPGTISLDRDVLSTPRLITVSQLIFISLFTVLLAWILFFLFLL